MKLQRYAMRATFTYGRLMAWDVEDNKGEWVRYEEAQAIEQERDALKAELAALKEWCYSDQELAIKILSYLGFSQSPSKEPYADRRRDRIAEMICQSRTAPIKPLSEKDITESGYYRQRDDDNCEWGVNYVCVDAGYMVQAGVAERLQIFGQFIGPIQMPEH